MFAPFALVVFEQILDWANSNVSEYLIFFEHNCVCANSKPGKSVCKCQRAKITWGENNLYTVDFQCELEYSSMPLYVVSLVVRTFYDTHYITFLYVCFCVADDFKRWSGNLVKFCPDTCI